MYDPKTGKYTAYQTCFGSHHLQFGYDANETLWASTGGGGGNVGWINTKMLDETGDIEKSQGWTALVLDTRRIGALPGHAPRRAFDDRPGGVRAQGVLAGLDRERSAGQRRRWRKLADHD